MIVNAISIEPYFDPEVPNMGYEKYGFSTAPGSELTEFISKDANGRYITGLDVDTPAVMNIEDPELKAAVEQEIKEVVERLERVFGKGALDARNENTWSNFSIKLGYTGKSLDRGTPQDELLYYAIKAGGFQAVAPSLEKATQGDYKFYLKHLEKDSGIKIEKSKLVRKAGGILVDLFEEDAHKLLLVAKVVLAPNNEFHEKTPISIIYDKLDQFIDGKIVKDNKKATVKQFLDAAARDIESLTIEALVRDALYFNFITREADGYFYNKQTEVRLGKNEKEVIKYISAPVNQLEFENLKNRVEAKFNK